MAAAHPPIDQQVTWVYTADLPGTAPFYADVLGLELALDQGQCRIFRAGPDSFIGLCHARPGRHVEPKGVVFTFVTPDVDGWHARFKAHGIDSLEAPQRSETFNVYAFFVRDPNGYLLEFQQFLDPAWPAPRG